MSWAKIDDRANEHAKQLAAGAKACWLWVCGLMYVNRQAKKTGRIPRAVVDSCMLFPSLGKREAEQLVKVGLWEVDADAYIVHDYGYWNPEGKPPKEPPDPGSLSEKRSEAGRKGGQRSAEARRANEANLLEANQANDQAKENEANKQLASRTAAPAYAHSRALDPPHPTPPQATKRPERVIQDLSGFSPPLAPPEVPDGTEAVPGVYRNGSQLVRLTPKWSPTFESFTSGGVSREVFNEALPTFRGYHIELGTEQPEPWFRSKLWSWARGDQVRHEANPRRSAASKPRQPDSGYDFSGAVEEADA